MFNDLNPAQNNRQPVDDIFAETDKPSNNPPGSIETHRVGLTSVNEGAPVIATDQTMAKSKLPWFKISAGIIILAILALSGYLVYGKFFKPSPAVVVVKTPVVNTVNDNTVVPTSTNEQASNTPVFVTEIPGLSSTTVSTSTSTELSTSTVASTIDTDSDGLTDAEEKILGTDPTKTDTDGDGLSDYEEVKIYHTNPLLADTDGDGFTDGNEVKNGYNPNGPGKMPGLTSANSATAATSSTTIVK